MADAKARERKLYFAIVVARPRTKASFDAIVSGTASALGVPARLLRARQGMVVALCEVAGSRDDRRAVAERVRTGIAKELGDPNLLMGVGHFRPNHAGAYLSTLQASQSFLVALALGRKGEAILFDEFEPYDFIFGRPRRDVRAFCARVLGELMASDARHERLMRTLDAYLRYNSVKTAASELKLHRNTVRLRIREAARLAHADLRDPDVRLTLRIALIGYFGLRRVQASLAALARQERATHQA